MQTPPINLRQFMNSRNPPVRHTERVRAFQEMHRPRVTNPPVRGFQITADIVQQFARRRPQSLEPSRINPFTFPRFPKAVEDAVSAAQQANPDGNVRLLAQDDMVGGTFGWASSDPMLLQYSEGVAFFGYTYLAALAQRAEYRQVTETIAGEMTREWIELKVASTDEQDQHQQDVAKKTLDRKKFVEDELDNLDAQKRFRTISEHDGFFGRAHLYLDTGVTEDADELITDLGDGRSVLSRMKVGPGKNQRLIRLHPVEANWCYPTYYESIDPLRRNFYDPVTWYVMSREIHRSRLLTFVGRPVPDLLKPAYAFGGIAMSQMLKPYVDNWLRTRQGISDLVQTFSYNVLRTNLDASHGSGGDQLWQRVALFNQVKNNQGVLVIDKDAEDWENISIPVGTLDRIQAQSQEHIAAISRIPLVKLLGIQPAGLNASSEGELIAFEDWIHSFQEILFRDALTTVIDLIQLSKYGDIDPNLIFDFKPIRQLKPIEQAQLESIRGQTREGYAQIGAVTAEEVREALANDEQTPFHGIDMKQPLPQAPGMPDMPPMPPMPGSPEGGSQGPQSTAQRMGNRPGFGAPMPQTMPRPPRPPTPGSPIGRPGSAERQPRRDAALAGYDIEEVDVIPLHLEPAPRRRINPIPRPRG